MRTPINNTIEHNYFSPSIILFSNSLDDSSSGLFVPSSPRKALANDGDEVSYNRVYHITTERYEESPEIMVEIGDVLLTKDGAGIGKLGYVKELPQEATINSSLLLIRPGNTAISKYIFYLLSGPELQSIVKERITGSATPHLFQRDIKEFTIPIPPLEEQEEIVRILDDVLEKEKIAYESAENVISQIELMKKSILKL